MIQLWYWYFYFNKLKNFNSSEGLADAKSFDRRPIDLIICMNKREPKLFDNLTAFLNQDYPSYRLLLVCDSIDDNLFDEVSKLKSRYGQLELLRIDNNPGGKKALLSNAIGLSENRIIALSDADCKPASNHWLTLMVQEMSHTNADVILGFSPYLVSNNTSLLQRWSLFESQITGIQYLSAALWNRTYMGVGRNLMYAPNILQPSILEFHNDLLSGDDDLSISQVSKTHKISICVKPESFVITYPENTWISYFNQKRRHFSTAHRYRMSHILLLSLFSLSHTITYLLFAVLLIYLPLIAIAGFLIRSLMLSKQAKSILASLRQNLAIKEFLLLDLLLFIYYIVFSFSVLFPKKTKMVR